MAPMCAMSSPVPLNSPLGPGSSLDCRKTPMRRTKSNDDDLFFAGSSPSPNYNLAGEESSTFPFLPKTKKRASDPHTPPPPPRRPTNHKKGPPTRMYSAGGKLQHYTGTPTTTPLSISKRNKLKEWAKKDSAKKQLEQKQTEKTTMSNPTSPTKKQEQRCRPPAPPLGSPNYTSASAKIQPRRRQKSIYHPPNDANKQSFLRSQRKNHSLDGGSGKHNEMLGSASCHVAMSTSSRHHVKEALNIIHKNSDNSSTPRASRKKSIYGPQDLSGSDEPDKQKKRPLQLSKSPRPPSLPTSSSRPIEHRRPPARGDMRQHMLRRSVSMSDLKPTLTKGSRGGGVSVCAPAPANGTNISTAKDCPTSSPLLGTKNDTPGNGNCLPDYHLALLAVQRRYGTAPGPDEQKVKYDVPVTDLSAGCSTKGDTDCVDKPLSPSSGTTPGSRRPLKASLSGGLRKAKSLRNLIRSDSGTKDQDALTHPKDASGRNDAQKQGEHTSPSQQDREKKKTRRFHQLLKKSKSARVLSHNSELLQDREEIIEIAGQPRGVKSMEFLGVSRTNPALKHQLRRTQDGTIEEDRETIFSPLTNKSPSSPHEKKGENKEVDHRRKFSNSMPAKKVPMRGMQSLKMMGSSMPNLFGAAIGGNGASLSSKSHRNLVVDDDDDEESLSSFADDDITTDGGATSGLVGKAGGLLTGVIDKLYDSVMNLEQVDMREEHEPSDKNVFSLNKRLNDLAGTYY